MITRCAAGISAGHQHCDGADDEHTAADEPDVLQHFSRANRAEGRAALVTARRAAAGDETHRVVVPMCGVGLAHRYAEATESEQAESHDACDDREWCASRTRMRLRRR